MQLEVTRKQSIHFRCECVVHRSVVAKVTVEGGNCCQKSVTGSAFLDGDRIYVTFETRSLVIIVENYDGNIDAGRVRRSGAVLRAHHKHKRRFLFAIEAHACCDEARVPVNVEPMQVVAPHNRIRHLKERPSVKNVVVIVVVSFRIEECHEKTPKRMYFDGTMP